ncbi:hypothetical protein EDB83DRAFT_302392 [Lactarius deliciosus]|nr:hypothetical protein EDB83DRAFT_302392 [Lactarius deliciosus]
MLTNAETPQGPPISSEECPQERRSSADSYSPSNRTKRRSVVASVDPDNGDLSINHKHATSNGKRQKYTKTLSETLSTSNGKAKIFPSLREQREQLPIARGAALSFKSQPQYLSPSPLSAQVGSHSYAVSRRIMWSSSLVKRDLESRPSFLNTCSRMALTAGRSPSLSLGVSRQPLSPFASQLSRGKLLALSSGTRCALTSV